MLQIGPCDYLEELRPLAAPVQLTAEAAPGLLQQEKQVQAGLLAEGVRAAGAVERAWAATDEPDELQPPPAPSDDHGYRHSNRPNGGSRSG
jgi:hypothetical protein